MEKIMIYTTRTEIALAITDIIREHNKHKEPDPEFTDQKMTIHQAANYIQVSYKTLCTWINSGLIPVHGKGRKRFVMKEELVDNYKKMKS